MLGQGAPGCVGADACATAGRQTSNATKRTAVRDDVKCDDVKRGTVTRDKGGTVPGEAVSASSTTGANVARSRL
jgi:hypothetical protein